MEPAFELRSNRTYCGWWQISDNQSFFESKKDGMWNPLYILVTNVPILYDYSIFAMKFLVALRLYKETLEKNSIVVNQKDTSTSWILLYTLLPAVIFLALLTTTAMYFVMKYRRKYVLSTKDADDFFKGLGTFNINQECLKPATDACEEEIASENIDGVANAQAKPYDKNRLEIKKKNFSIDTSRPLGAGEFGMVWFGEIKVKSTDATLKVAVKMMNDQNQSENTLKGLLSEIKILAYIGEHKHVVELLGAYKLTRKI